MPYYHETLDELTPARVLEVGGGTGHLALELASHAEEYVLLEPSAGMYECASETLSGSRIQALNVTLEDLPVESKFDLVLSHMCAHAASDLDGFVAGIASHLAETGTYVLSLPHPAFYNEYKHFIASKDFSYMVEQSAIVSFAPTLDPNGLIEGVPYYHRPISRYFHAIAAAGLCVTNLHEVFPSAEIQARYGLPWESPRYLVLRGGHVRAGGSA